VPVSLKIDMVKNAAADEEGALYKEIGRSRPWHQGICVVNSAGKVLDWTIGFDDDKSVFAFFDHCARRFKEFPDAKKPITVERYAQFPGRRESDVADNGVVPVIIDGHPQGKHCPAEIQEPEGTLLARVFGRALERDGTPVADTVPQENYVEDRLHVPAEMQETVAKAAGEAGAKRFLLPFALGHLLMSHAFLGHLDVNPLSDLGSTGNVNQCSFWGEKEEGGGATAMRIYVTGESEVGARTSDAGRPGDRAVWRHDVKLAWEGIIELDGQRMTRLIMVARGAEKLKWSNPFLLPDMKPRADVTALVAGHAIDLECPVRYGIVGEPAAHGDERTSHSATRTIP
jgi:hypothetical protein